MTQAGLVRRYAVPALVLGLLAAATPSRSQGYGSPAVQQQKVQLSALGGWAFGGSVRDVALGDDRSFAADTFYGGALDLRVAPGWNVELGYTRQPTRLEGGGLPPFGVTLERYLLGIQEEKGDQKVRWFGTFSVGATRFVPEAGFDATTKFTGGVDLGMKAFFTKNVGLRLEVRGFYTVVNGSGGVACVNGTCLFAFNGTGLWQGDVGGGLILGF